MNRAIMVTGLARSASQTIPLLEKEANHASVNLRLAYTWATSGDAAPSNSPDKFRVIGNQDIDSLSNFAKSRFVESLVPEYPAELDSWANREIGLVSQLSLLPNPKASWGWLSALSGAGQLIAELPPETTVLLTRPDLYWCEGSIEWLFNTYEKLDASVSLCAARPVKFEVLPTFDRKFQQLPIDHWWIGRAGELQEIHQISDWLLSRSGREETLPLVNEFVIGRFWSEKIGKLEGIVAPYTLWRELGEPQSLDNLSEWDKHRFRLFAKSKNDIQLDYYPRRYRRFTR